MLNLRKNYGSVLEPFAGDGMFYNSIPDCIGIELDPDVCPDGCFNMDFFDLPVSEKFDSIITNPPYVQGKRILEKTRQKIKSDLPGKTNLYIFCIEKMYHHLNDGGEMILLNPLDFLRTTSSSTAVNEMLLANGAITHVYDVSGQNIFKNANPDSCCVWRYERGKKQGLVETEDGQKKLLLHNGRIFLVDPNHADTIPFSDLFYVKVGAVPGAGAKYFDDNGTQFVYSKTRVTGDTRGMNYVPEEWIRRKPNQSDAANPRVYVNNKTLTADPFFVHPCRDWDGSILAIFPINTGVDIEKLRDAFNNVDWQALGFVWHGKFVFTSGSLTNCLLPADAFEEFR